MKKFKKGTKVIVTDKGQHYDTYYVMAELLKLPNWERSPRVINGERGVVIGSHKHEHTMDICYGVRFEDGTEAIIGHSGLEAIGFEKLKEKSKPKTPAQKTISKLKKLQKSAADVNAIHSQADKILCDFLNELGYKEVVAEYKRYV